MKPCNVNVVIATAKLIENQHFTQQLSDLDRQSAFRHFQLLEIEQPAGKHYKTLL